MENGNSPVFTDEISTWLTRVTGIAASLATIFAVFFPTSGEKTKIVAYIVAIVLVLCAVSLFVYKKRKSPRIIVQPGEPIPSTAVLRGLLPFEDGDKLIGRTVDLQALNTLVRSSGFRFGVVWGQSGCGKTSLLRAGFVPALREQGVRPLYLIKPTADPIAAINTHVTSTNGSHHTSTSEDELSGELLKPADGYTSTLIIIDQFEEYFLINRTKQSVEPFQKWLTRCVDDANLPVRFLISIREDFFARLQKLAPDGSRSTSGFDPTSRQTSLEVENLRARQAKEILVASLATDNTSFEQSLVDRLVQELETDGYIRPPELQLVATYLKRKGITERNQYESLGGSQGILSSYIKEEINRSPSEFIARLTLRLMCVPETGTKSPVDISLDDFEKALSAHNLKTSESLERLQGVLQQLITARIVLRTDDDKYNLVHDYFAPLVLSATEGLETPTERADRMFRRYIAQYKDDAKLRIPLRHISLIRKHASSELLATVNGKALLRKSVAYAFVPVLIPLAILIVPIVASYLVLTTSYYLSTVASNYKGGSPHIVVRAGRPNLKFLPGFDHVAVDSTFSMDDLPTENAEASDVFPREVLSGFYRTGKNGYSEWVEHIVGRMHVTRQVQAYRLLKNPRASRDVWLKAIQDKPNISLAFSLGLLAKADPAAVTDDVLQPVKELASASNTPPQTRFSALFALSEIAKDKSAPLPAGTPSLMDLLDQMRGIIQRSDSFGDHPSWNSTTIELALISHAHANPSEVGPNEVNKAIDFVKDGHVDPFAKWNVLRVIEAFAESNPELSEHAVKELLAYAISQNLGDRDWSTQDVVDSAVAIGRDNPKAVTSDSMSAFEALLKQKSISDETLAAAVIPYSILVKANPAVIDPNLVEVLRKTIRESARNVHARTACAIALTRLGTVREQWKDREAVSQTINAVQAQKEESLSGLRRFAASALGELAAVDASMLGNASSIVESCIDTFNDKEASGNRDQDKDIDLILAQLGRAGKDAVSATAVKMQIDSMMNPTFSGNDVVAAKSLVSLARFAPKYILDERERLYDVKVVRLSLQLKEIHQWVLGAIARARYEELRRSDPQQVFQKLLAQVESSDDLDARLFGTYGLFLLTIDEPGAIAHAREALNELANSTEPHRRIAGAQALEMIRIAELVDGAHRDKRLLTINRSKLELQQRYSEPHMDFASQIALEAL
jgi:hypothetical protein